MSISVMDTICSEVLKDGRDFISVHIYDYEDFDCCFDDMCISDEVTGNGPYGHEVYFDDDIIMKAILDTNIVKDYIDDVGLSLNHLAANGDEGRMKLDCYIRDFVLSELYGQLKSYWNKLYNKINGD